MQTILGNLGANNFVGAFSVSQINTGERLYYLFARRNSDNNLFLSVCNEQFKQLHSTSLGTVSDTDPVITYAVQNQQIIINSPSFSTAFYGYVGSSVVPALKLASEDETDTPAINIPTGICCAFGDRIAIAQGNIVYFNEPDFQIRTFTGANSSPMPGGGTIYDMVQGSDGNLYLICSNGIFYFTRDALLTSTVFGTIGTIKGYEATAYRCAVAVGSTIFCPDTNQMTAISNSGDIESIPIVKYRSKRYFSLYVGAQGDLRKGKMFKTQTRMDPCCKRFIGSIRQTNATP